MSRTPARLGAATLAAGAAVLIAGPAFGHVTVSSLDAAREGYGKATFRVPNESEDASTTRLVITLPTDTPLASVTAQVKPGWDVEVEKAKLPEPVTSGDATLTEAVRTVTWTAEKGVGIAPGEFDEFALSGGPFPDVDELTFEAEQTYDDGEVVDWAEVAEDGEEPARPAPVLTLAEASAGGHGHGAGTADEADRAADEETSSTDGLARGLSIAALVLGAGALLLALRENRRRA